MPYCRLLVDSDAMRWEFESRGRASLLRKAPNNVLLHVIVDSSDVFGGRSRDAYTTNFGVSASTNFLPPSIHQPTSTIHLSHHHLHPQAYRSRPLQQRKRQACSGALARLHGIPLSPAELGRDGVLLRRRPLAKSRSCPGWAFRKSDWVRTPYISIKRHGRRTRRPIQAVERVDGGEQTLQEPPQPLLATTYSPYLVHRLPTQTEGGTGFQPARLLGAVGSCSLTLSRDSTAFS